MSDTIWMERLATIASGHNRISNSKNIQLINHILNKWLNVCLKTKCIFCQNVEIFWGSEVTFALVGFRLQLIYT